MRCKAGLAAALAVVLVIIVTNNVRGNDAPSRETLPGSEQDAVSPLPMFDPLVPEITDLEEAESVAR